MGRLLPPVRHIVVPAATLVLVALAGCLDSPGAAVETGSAATIIQAQCGGAAAGRCAMEDGRLVLSGLDLAPTAPGRDVYFPETTPRIGLLVDGLTVPLVIEAVYLTGFWTGIALRDTCAACPIEIRDSRIEATYTAVQVGKTAPVRGDLALVRSSIIAVDTPPSARLAPGDVRGVGVDAGLHGRGTFEANLTVEDVTLDALGRALGPGLTWNMTRGAPFEARNLTVLGFENSLGIGGEPGNTIRLLEVAVDCRGPAFYTTETAARALHAGGRASVFVENMDVRNCGWAEGCYPQCGEAIRIGRAGRGRTDATEDVVMKNITLQNNIPTALSITQHERVTLEDVLIEDGLEGVGEISAVELVMRNVTFRNLAWRAAAAFVERLDVDRAVFEENGLRSRQDGYLVGGGFYVGGAGSPRVIRNSSFVDNEPIGLYAGHSLMDAAYNWWGSPLGPSRQVPMPGFGDGTDGLMVTVPHLTAPP